MNADLDSFNDKAKNISQLVDEHMAWLHDVSAGNTDTPLPEGFIAWVDGARARQDIGDDHHKELKSLHEAMISADPARSMKKFVYAHRDFMKVLRENEKIILSQSNDVRDGSTGLGTFELLQKDYKTEMERLARNGHAFCMAMILPDDVHDAGNLKMLAEKMRSSKRNFDDVYRVADQEFVMMLRQTDVAGAMAAFNRLRNMLERDKASTVSVCVIEPVEGEKLENIIEKLRYDLGKVERQTDVLIEHLDISPLQRYITEKQE